VEVGAVVARIDAGATPLLDARTRAETQASIESARAALGAARAEEQRSEAALAQARRELERTRTLTAGGVLPTQVLDAREADVRLAEEAARAAAFSVTGAGAELRRAEARLAGASTAPRGGVVSVTAPARGVILRRLHESEAVVLVGAPLVEIGDLANMEIVSDLLSTDAVRVKIGARATIEQWGSDTALAAVVRRVEPSGFTKISALGVEEQRVNVILDLADSPGEGAVLGDGYRVEVRIVEWEAADVVKLPTAAMFRDGDQWAVYVVRDGRARLTPVEIGRQTGREAEVLGGVAEGTAVIVHPPAAVADGVRISQ
jgi:HlyD family secretion protein